MIANCSDDRSKRSRCNFNNALKRIIFILLCLLWLLVGLVGISIVYRSGAYRIFLTHSLSLFSLFLFMPLSRFRRRCWSPLPVVNINACIFSQAPVTYIYIYTCIFDRSILSSDVSIHRSIDRSNRIGSMINLITNVLTCQFLIKLPERSGTGKREFPRLRRLWLDSSSSYCGNGNAAIAANTK